MTKWCMRISWWILKITNTNSDYVKPIYFPLQQRLYKPASTLRYNYIACFVVYFTANSIPFLRPTQLLCNKYWIKPYGA